MDKLAIKSSNYEDQARDLNKAKFAGWNPKYLIIRDVYGDYVFTSGVIESNSTLTEKIPSKTVQYSKQWRISQLALAGECHI
ncbi:hypothetical protein BpHYR1_052208 [Brachionus plicatilis]|uniref:Uncharacterized protein n=1 Tax=Brachionus plicatilis TaxID=10195 RepID=A0A3M7S4M8_BRAPC|nr:hypothetical protein BpHYR1_052208 [Brachionus plicatilis]